LKIFIKKKKNVKLSEVLRLLKIDNYNDNKSEVVNDIKDIMSAKNNEITFFNNLKYKDQIKNSKASFCIIKKNFLKLLPNTCTPLVVDNVLVSLSKITNLFYPNSINDDYDSDLLHPNGSKNFSNVHFGNNVLLGKNVKIGNECFIGHNSIIESNVIIGNQCSIGSNVIIRKSVIGNNVNVLDGAIIGKKGFGFFPNQNSNIRYPHIGLVIIGNDVEIGCNCVIDRGSLSNTIIDNNTYLDNQVHVAHNVRIGKNCIIAGQVGFAGSSKIGDNVMIGGQAGISGHLDVGDNVKIGGGSGVIDDIPDNDKVMGYPAKNIKKFIKINK